MTQAFDKVWHLGLLSKIKCSLPYALYEILKSYLTNRHFLVKYGDATTPLQPISSGVPQGSVLGPVLYLIYTADLPTTRNTVLATFADDTVIMASHHDPIVASRHLQNHLRKIEDWIKTWRIRVNPQKSVQVTFTTRRGSCPPVQLNGKFLPQKDETKYLGIHLDQR